MPQTSGEERTSDEPSSQTSTATDQRRTLSTISREDWRNHIDAALLKQLYQAIGAYNKAYAEAEEHLFAANQNRTPPNRLDRIETCNLVAYASTEDKVYTLQEDIVDIVDKVHVVDIKPAMIAFIIGTTKGADNPSSALGRYLKEQLAIQNITRQA